MTVGGDALESDQFNFTFSKQKWANGCQSADLNTIHNHQRQPSIVSDSHVNVSDLLNSALSAPKPTEGSLDVKLASTLNKNDNSLSIGSSAVNFVAGPKDYQNFLHQEFSVQSTPKTAE